MENLIPQAGNAQRMARVCRKNAGRLAGERCVVLGADHQLFMEKPGLYNDPLAGWAVLYTKGAKGSGNGRRCYQRKMLLVCGLSAA